jgi:hypothetical protein
MEEEAIALRKKQEQKRKPLALIKSSYILADSSTS